jgi:glyoxylase-like metal-dependent hydrolase (beta-lactamase superfamily II)
MGGMRQNSARKPPRESSVPPVSRRRFLSNAVHGSMGASLGALAWRSGALFAQPAAAAGGVELPQGYRLLSLGATNVLAVATDAGFVLVDSGAPAHAADLQRAVGGAVHTLFNSHWHADHTGGNERLANSGTTIVAHENTRLWTTQKVTWPWNEETVEPLPKTAQPAQTFRDKLEVVIGGKRIECGHLRDCPHTDGDIYVYFADDNVLAVGDALYGPDAGWPALDWWTGGWIGGMVGALDVLFYVADEDTVIVPSHGRAMTRAELRSQHEMYGTVWETLLRTLYSGGGPDEALEARPTAPYEAVMGDADVFLRRAFESLWAYLSPDA